MERQVTLKGVYKCVPYLIIVPGLALMLILNWIPISQALFRSFFFWRGGKQATFVGLGNFQELITDPVFRISMINLGKILFIRVLLTVSIPIFIAELIFGLSRRPHLERFYRVLYILPMLVSTIVTLLIWQFIYDGYVGLLNSMLKSFGLEHFTRDWLGDFKTALYGISFISFPWVHPYLCALTLLACLAALQNIDQDIFDASKIDGAIGLTRFFRIDLGIIIEQMKVILILIIVMLAQDFIGILILTDGGPGYSTMVPGVYLYRNAFYYARMGYACTIGIVIFAIIFSLTVIVRKLRVK